MAEVCAIAGLALGVLATLVPGFPGCVVALLGVAAYAGMTDFQVVTREAAVLAALIALAGVVAQVAAPITGARVAGGTAGAATGAALGALGGALVAVPGVALAAACVGALLFGVVASKGAGPITRLRGSVGAAGGCFLAVVIDLIAVLGVGAVLAVAQFTSNAAL